MKGFKSKRYQNISKFNAFCVIFLISCFFIQKASGSNLIFPDFKTSMLRDTGQIDKYINRKQIYESANRKYVQLFEDNYIRLAEIVRNDRNEMYRIPPIVHQIWLGSKVPEKYKSWMESWMKLRGWQYMLWTDEEAKKFPMRNRDLYERSSNYGEKSDILRLEILCKYGGLYVDTDFECVRPELFEELHSSFDFYIGFEPLEHGMVKFKMFKMCNAIIAAIPEHPLIKDLVENMRANFFAYRSHTGPIGTTGPSYITRIICEYMESHIDTLRNMCFPSTLFYPFSVLDIQRFCDNQEDSLPVFPETAAIHYWNMSWVKCAAIKNEYSQTVVQAPKLELRHATR
jgi:mannosyltransferase OCH1-like enzyme